MNDTLVDRVEAAVKPRLRGVLHEAGFAIALVTGTVLVVLSRGALQHLATSIYASSVILLFGTSASYHRGRWSPRAHALLMRLDHSMIFVLIAGSYTPFALVVLDGWPRWVVFSGVWAAAAVGITARNAVRIPPGWIFTGLYLALGWGALALVPELLEEGGVAVVVLLLAGGVLYSAGAVVYARQRPNPSPRWFGFHEVFHAFTLAAFVVHYVAISLAVYRA